MIGVEMLRPPLLPDHPYKVTEIRQIKRATQRGGRDIVLSLSPGPTQLEHHAEVAELAQMWRMSNDIWDMWDSHNTVFPIGIRSQSENAAKWAQHAGPGHWPDADMLFVGELSFYPDVGRGPRHTRLTPNERQALHEGDLVAWTADLPGGERALALFNAGEKPISVDRNLTDFALPAGPFAIRNVWTGERVKAGSRVGAALKPQACILLMLTKK
jgi:alpha-galactosidase